MVAPRNPGTEGPEGHAATPPLGAGWNGYIDLAGPRLTISGIDMVPSYGALEAVSDTGPLAPERPFALNPAALSLFGSLMYFIEARVVGDGAVLSSPSAPTSSMSPSGSRAASPSSICPVHRWRRRLALNTGPASAAMKS